MIATWALSYDFSPKFNGLARCLAVEVGLGSDSAEIKLSAEDLDSYLYYNRVAELNQANFKVHLINSYPELSRKLQEADIRHRTLIGNWMLGSDTATTQIRITELRKLASGSSSDSDIAALRRLLLVNPKIVLELQQLQASIQSHAEQLHFLESLARIYHQNRRCKPQLQRIQDLRLVCAARRIEDTPALLIYALSPVFTAPTPFAHYFGDNSGLAQIGPAATALTQAIIDQQRQRLASASKPNLNDLCLYVAETHALVEICRSGDLVFNTLVSQAKNSGLHPLFRRVALCGLRRYYFHPRILKTYQSLRLELPDAYKTTLANCIEIVRRKREDLGYEDLSYNE